MNRNRIAAGAAMCCAVLFVGACGGTPPTGVADAAPTTVSSGGGAAVGGGAAAGGARALPGATGLLAQIEGTTLQVQSTDTQTAVTYSAATTFTNTVAAKASDVVVGACIQARSARPVSGTAGAAPTAAPGAADGPVMAASVEISPAVNGTCSVLGGLRTPGARPTGATGDPTLPTGTPTAGQTRGPGAGPGGSGGTGSGVNGLGGLGAFGKVTAVNGTSITVESSRPQGSPAATAAPTTAVPTTQTVQTSATTTYTRTGVANAKALAIGLCVTALGKASDTGSIAATSIMLRPAENGSCSTGLGRRAAGGSPTSTGGGSGA